MSRFTKTILAAGFVGVLGATAGCAGSYTYASDPYYAESPPPAPYVEVRGVAPYQGAVWIDGYWVRASGRYVWHRGHYDRPRPGYVYVPHRWTRQGRGWRMQAGHWRRGGGYYR